VVVEGVEAGGARWWRWVVVWWRRAEESCDEHLEETRLDRQRVQAIAAVQEFLKVLVEVLEDEGQLLLGVDHVVKPAERVGGGRGEGAGGRCELVPAGA